MLPQGDLYGRRARGTYVRYTRRVHREELEQLRRSVVMAADTTSSITKAQALALIAELQVLQERDVRYHEVLGELRRALGQVRDL